MYRFQFTEKGKKSNETSRDLRNASFQRERLWLIYYVQNRCHKKSFSTFGINQLGSNWEFIKSKKKTETWGGKFSELLTRKNDQLSGL